MRIPAFPYTRSGVFVHASGSGVGGLVAADAWCPGSPPSGIVGAMCGVVANALV
jgi:hypothetical protein